MIASGGSLVLLSCREITSFVITGAVETSIVFMREFRLILCSFPFFSVSLAVLVPYFLSKFASIMSWSVALLFRRAFCWYVSSCPAFGTVRLLWAILFEVAWLFTAKAESSIWCTGSIFLFTAFHSFTIYRLRNVSWTWIYVSLQLE